MKLQAEIPESGLYQLVVNDIQSCLLFRHKEHFFSVMKALCYNIRDCLTLACSRRSLQDKTLSMFGHENSFHLTGVRVYDRVQRNNRILCFFRDILRNAVDRLPEQSQNIVILKHLFFMIDQIMIHVDLEERKKPYSAL